MNPAQKILSGLLVLRIFHQHVGEGPGQVELTAGPARDLGMQDVVLHRLPVCGLVGIGLALRLDIYRGAIVGGADAAGQEGAVVARIVPGKPALVHRLLPQRHSEFDRFHRLLAVQRDGLAIRLDLLAAPRPQIRVPPARRVAEGMPGCLTVRMPGFFQLLTGGAVLVPGRRKLAIETDFGEP